MPIKTLYSSFLKKMESINEGNNSPLLVNPLVAHLLKMLDEISDKNNIDLINDIQNSNTEDSNSQEPTFEDILFLIESKFNKMDNPISDEIEQHILNNFEYYFVIDGIKEIVIENNLSSIEELRLFMQMKKANTCKKIKKHCRIHT